MKKRILSIAKYIILISFSILFLYPFVWLFISSFKTNSELFENPWGLPRTFVFSNYVHAIKEGHLLRYFGNSILITGIAVLVTVLLGSMASYAISRMKWKLSKLVYRLFILGITIPVYAMIIPLFSMFNKTGLINTYWAVILPHIAISFPVAILIMTGFMQSLPQEMEEAAIIDGCNIFQLFFKVIFPVTRSSIVTVAVVSFIDIWNDLLLPQIFLTDTNKMTLPVGLTEFQGKYMTNYVVLMAAVIITIVPSIIAYVKLHKNIMEGMVAGAVKG